MGLGGPSSYWLGLRSGASENEVKVSKNFIFLGLHQTLFLIMVLVLFFFCFFPFVCSVFDFDLCCLLCFVGAVLVFVCIRVCLCLCVFVCLFCFVRFVLFCFVWFGLFVCLFVRTYMFSPFRLCKTLQISEHMPQTTSQSTGRILNREALKHCRR